MWVEFMGKIASEHPTVPASVDASTSHSTSPTKHSLVCSQPQSKSVIMSEPWQCVWDTCQTYWLSGA